MKKPISNNFDLKIESVTNCVQEPVYTWWQLEIRMKSKHGEECTIDVFGILAVYRHEVTGSANGNFNFIVKQQKPIIFTKFIF